MQLHNSGNHRIFTHLRAFTFSRDYEQLTIQRGFRAISSIVDLVLLLPSRRKHLSRVCVVYLSISSSLQLSRFSQDTSTRSMVQILGVSWEGGLRYNGGPFPWCGITKPTAIAHLSLAVFFLVAFLVCFFLVRRSLAGAGSITAPIYHQFMMWFGADSLLPSHASMNE